MKRITTFELFEEGKTFQVTKKPFEKKPWDTDKREAFRKKVQDLVKSQGCTIKQIGNDFEIYLKENHIAQAMFRDSFVGIKTIGKKFVDEFKYNELGKIKSKLNAIIKINKSKYENCSDIE